MGNFAIGNLRKTKEHKLPCGATITVNDQLLVWEQEEIANKGAEMGQFTLMLEMVAKFVVKWNFSEKEDGEPYPITIETIKKFPDNILSEIMEAITGKSMEELRKIGAAGGDIMAVNEDKKKD